MKQYSEAVKLRQQFKRNNTKNYVYALIGKVIFAVMTVSLSLLLTFFIEAVEYKSMEKLTFEELLEQKGYFYSLYHISQ